MSLDWCCETNSADDNNLKVMVLCLEIGLKGLQIIFLVSKCKCACSVIKCIHNKLTFWVVHLIGVAYCT